MTTYRVLAVTGYAGHKAGDTFEAELDPAAEARALARGSIKKLPAKKPKPEEEEVDDE